MDTAIDAFYMRNYGSTEPRDRFDSPILNIHSKTFPVWYKFQKEVINKESFVDCLDLFRIPQYNLKVDEFIAAMIKDAKKSIYIASGITEPDIYGTERIASSLEEALMRGVNVDIQVAGLVRTMWGHNHLVEKAIELQQKENKGKIELIRYDAAEEAREHLVSDSYGYVDHHFFVHFVVIDGCYGALQMPNFPDDGIIRMIRFQGKDAADKMINFYHKGPFSFSGITKIEDLEIRPKEISETPKRVH